MDAFFDCIARGLAAAGQPAFLVPPAVSGLLSDDRSAALPVPVCTRRLGLRSMRRARGWEVEGRAVGGVSCLMRVASSYSRRASSRSLRSRSRFSRSRLSRCSFSLASFSSFSLFNVVTVFVFSYLLPPAPPPAPPPPPLAAAVCLPAFRLALFGVLGSSTVLFFRLVDTATLGDNGDNGD